MLERDFFGQEAKGFPTRRIVHWYTRHQMWAKAFKLRKASGVCLDFLDDLNEVEYNDCLKAVNKEWSHVNEEKSGAVRVYCGARAERDKGPASYAQCGDQTLSSYNGVGGGRVFRWYDLGVFQVLKFQVKVPQPYPYVDVEGPTLI